MKVYNFNQEEDGRWTAISTNVETDEKETLGTFDDLNAAMDAAYFDGVELLQKPA